MRKVVISSCIECPYLCKRSTNGRFYCNNVNRYLIKDPSVETEEFCPLEEVNLKEDNKVDHSAALRHIYGIIQRKGLCGDSLHDANTYLNQYLRELNS